MVKRKPKAISTKPQPVAVATPATPPAGTKRIVYQPSQAERGILDGLLAELKAAQSAMKAKERETLRVVTLICQQQGLPPGTAYSEDDGAFVTGDAKPAT